MKISAVIFDLDGTVLDSEDVWGNAFRKVLKKLGKEVSDKYPQEGGIGVAENWSKLLAKYHIKTNETLEELTADTNSAYLEELSLISVRPGFKEFTDQLKESGIKIGLATSSIWYVVEKVFDEFDLNETFDAVTTGEEVSFKKPSPELFLVTADKLDEAPNECLVIEDSASGVLAAKAAGMKVVGITNDAKAARSLAGTNLIVKSFAALTPEVLASL